jgi:hypothetical protein
MTLFVTFGSTNRFYRSLGRLVAQAKYMNVFRDVLGYTEQDLDPNFLVDHSEFLFKPHAIGKTHCTNGFGFMIWKPQILLQAFELAEPNELIVYCDCGCTLNPSGLPKLKQYLDETPDLHVFQLQHLEKTWTKGDVLALFPERFRHTPQILSGLMIFRKVPVVKSLLEDWKRLCSVYSNVDNSPSRHRNDPTFREHRHDQSLWSLLVKTFPGSVKISPDGTYFERFDDHMDEPVHATRIRDPLRSFASQINGMRWIETKQDLITTYIECKRNHTLHQTFLTTNPKVLAWAKSMNFTSIELKESNHEEPERLPEPQAAIAEIKLPPQESSTPETPKQMLCLILHCEKYAHRDAKYVQAYRKILEDIGFRCVYVLGSSYETTTLIDDRLYVPVQEAYTRCHLKMYHAYLWAKTQNPTLLLKIDDDITIVNEALFRAEYARAFHFDYTVVKFVTCGGGMSYIYKKDDENYRRGYPIKHSTYGVGGLHFLSPKALHCITLGDMTQTIFEDLNMGLLAKRYKWTVTDLRWIVRHVTTFEDQSE